MSVILYLPASIYRFLIHRARGEYVLVYTRVLVENEWLEILLYKKPNNSHYVPFLTQAMIII